MRFRLSTAVFACVIACLLPGIAEAEVKLSPMAGTPLTGTGGGGIIESVDLNGDGLDDLAIGSTTGSSRGIHVRMASADGTWVSRPTLLSGAAVGNIQAGDFNGDDDPDLVVTVPDISPDQSDWFVVLLGKGDGTFADPMLIATDQTEVVTVPVSGQASLPTDLDRDGHQDLLFALSGGRLGGALGFGDGTFADLDAGVLDGAPTGASEGFSSIVAGDFNGDQKSDLALGLRGGSPSNSSNSGVMVIYENDQGQGPIQFPLAAPFAPVERLAGGDVNGDGFDELFALSAAEGSADPRVLVQSGSASGLSASTMAFDLARPASDLVSSDFSGDGLSDVAWVEHFQASGRTRSVLALATRRGGAFSRISNDFDLDFTPDPGRSFDAEVGDFNGDGSPDVATSFAGGVSVLLNRADPSVAQTSIDFGVVKKGSIPPVRQLDLANAGGATAKVSRIEFTGQGASAFSAEQNCSEVSPAGGTCSSAIRLATSSAGTFGATARVVFADGSTPIEVPLSGRISSGQGSFSAGQIGFDDVLIGSEPKSSSIVLSSTGSDPLSVGQLSLSGSEAGGFNLSEDQCSGRTLAPGTSCSFTLTTAISKPGGNSAAVEVPTDDANLAPRIPVTANGVAPTYLAKVKVAGPAKVKAGKKARFVATVSNSGTGVLTGLTLAYKVTQGRSVKSKGQVKLGALIVGGSVRKPLSIVVKPTGLKRGTPLKYTFSVTRSGRTIASASRNSRLARR